MYFAQNLGVRAVSFGRPLSVILAKSRSMARALARYPDVRRTIALPNEQLATTRPTPKPNLKRVDAARLICTSSGRRSRGRRSCRCLSRLSLAVRLHTSRRSARDSRLSHEHFSTELRLTSGWDDVFRENEWTRALSDRTDPLYNHGSILPLVNIRMCMGGFR